MIGRRRLAAIGVAIVCLPAMLAGCRGNGLISCSGQVTLNGKPLADGTIEFRPVDGDGPTAGALIAQGRYAVLLSPGRKQVVIQAFRTAGEVHAIPDDPESPLVPLREEIRLTQYTKESPATLDIAAGNLDFQLQAGP